MPLTAAEQAIVDHLAAEPGPITWASPPSPGGWVAHVRDGGGGAGPYRPRPWVNFAASWNTNLFAAGGQVIGDGAEAAHLVRLTFADGTALTDRVHNGIVLFFAAPGIAFPAKVEILSTAGDTLAGYDEFTDLG